MMCKRKSNQIRWLLLGALVSLASLSAQSITFVATNPAISPSMVLDDSWTLTISGAAANASVVLQYTQDGGSAQNFTVGTTNASGNFTDVQEVGNPVSIGLWTNKWLVGGTQLGPEFDYEVVDKPTGLHVESVSAASPNCSYLYSGAIPYGAAISVEYQITGASGSVAPGTEILFVPIEDITTYDVYGDVLEGPDTAYVGTNTGPWSPPSARNAAYDGTFYDVPIANCSNTTYSGWQWSKQSISINVGSYSYSVRPNQYFTSSATGVNQGSTSTSYGDISFSN